MPATPDHKVAVHRLARERVNAGKPVWAHKIDLRHVFHQDRPFTEWRDSIVAALTASRWVKDTRDADEYGHLGEIIAELADTTDLAEFNQVWDAVYDEADQDRVWITTR